MSKKFVLFLLTSIILLSYLFNFEKVIVSKLSMLHTTISSTYIQIFVATGDMVSKYFSQLRYIEELKKSNEENHHYKSLYQQKVAQIRELNNVSRISLDKYMEYEKIKILSYNNMYVHTEVIIDKNYIPKDMIYPLITLDGYSAGIAMNKNNRSIAYLNENNKCNYTVYIGDDNAPGITSGVEEDGNIIIKYVPIWKEVQIDDEVITSSMDSIFPFGIKVGKVIDIKVFDNTKEVLVKPFAKTYGVRNFFLINQLGANI